MYEVGDLITLHGLTGRISEVHKKTRIGFIPTKEVDYDIIFEKVPEHLIIEKKDGNNSGNTTVPPQEEGKPT